MQYSNITGLNVENATSSYYSNIHLSDVQY